MENVRPATTIHLDIPLADRLTDPLATLENCGSVLTGNGMLDAFVNSLLVTIPEVRHSRRWNPRHMA